MIGEKKKERESQSQTDRLQCRAGSLCTIYRRFQEVASGSETIVDSTKTQERQEADVSLPDGSGPHEDKAHMPQSTHTLLRPTELTP